MSDISVNIGNAFNVVHQTYVNVKKILAFCDKEAKQLGFHINNQRYLRYKSDNHVDGWYTQGLIKTYRKDDNEESVYAININFYGEPAIYVSKHIFIDDAPTNIRPDKYWLFDNPIGETCPDEFITEKLNNDVYHVVTLKGYIEKYKGLSEAYYKVLDIGEVNRENLSDLVFGTYNDLDKLKG